MATSVETQRQEAAITEEERIRQQQRRERRNQWIFRILGYVVVFGIWELASGSVLDESLLPPPFFGEHSVLQTALDLWQDPVHVLSAFRSTLTRIFIGFGIAFIVGAAIGILSQNRWWEGFFKDFVVVGITSPEDDFEPSVWRLPRRLMIRLGIDF